MTQPVISVIIAAFNQEKYISRCLRSLLAQTISRDKFEIVVINDGSTDRSASVLGEFSGEIVLIDNEKNIGLPASLNKAIRRARAPYVVRVDADELPCSVMRAVQCFFRYQSTRFRRQTPLALMHFCRCCHR